MTKVTIEIGRIVVQGSTSEECKEILDVIYPQFLEAHKNHHISPQIKVKYSHKENTPIEEEKALKFDSEVIESPRLYPTYRKNFISPIEESYSSPSTRNDRKDKKLVFFKCTECGTIACSLMNPNEKARCYCCNNIFELGELFVGSYNCSCGQRGRFLMQESVSEVECKGCKTKHVMVKDSDGEYIAL